MQVPVEARGSGKELTSCLSAEVDLLTVTSLPAQPNTSYFNVTFSHQVLPTIFPRIVSYSNCFCEDCVAAGLLWL